jgi:hypothetical protein
MNSRQRVKRNHGNVLVLTTALFLGLVLAICLFSMSFTRMTGSHQEQKSAIEAAALAVADDLSRIVIEDPNFGFISLSDSPPTQAGTIAGDHYFTSVQGINTLMARIRLDMIIADQLQNATMKKLLANEYQLARQACDRLSSTLASAVLPGGWARGADGSTIRPYNDAQQAYLSNSIRMNGGRSSLKQGSLKITLGLAKGLSTNTPVPNPPSAAQLNSSTMMENNFYLPFVDVPYDGYDFVLSGGDDGTTLVDVKTFSTNATQLPFAVLDIVKCEADELTEYKNQYAETAVATLHIAACAQPACVRDPLPNESALAVRFSSGRFPEVTRPGDLLVNPRIQYSPADSVGSPLNGDYPQTPLSPIVLSTATTTHPAFGQVVTLAIYDWIRNQGLNINVGSLINFFNNSFDTSIPANLPQVHYFRASTGGNIVETVQADDPTLALPVSQNQYFAVSGDIISTAINPTAVNTSNKQWFDMFVRDFVYKSGRAKGGLHAGTPFGILGATLPAPTSPIPVPLDEGANRYAVFPSGAMGGAVRPTYLKMGTAVEIRFRIR